MESHLPALLAIGFIATLSPLLANIPMAIRLPIVVVEILLGIIVGPHVIGWVQPTAELKFFGDLGMVFLFFMAGMELRFHHVQGKPLMLGTAAWIVSLFLAIGVGYVLSWTGLIDTYMLVAIALTTTAIGPLIPILKDAGEFDTKFGRMVLGAGALGELGPILSISLLMGKRYETTDQALLMIAFVFVAVISVYGASKIRLDSVVNFFRKWLHSNSQLAVRASILILVGLVALAGSFGLDVILGSFVAGMTVELMCKGNGGEVLRNRLKAIAFGFLIPAFFVTSGINFDLGALVASPLSLLMLPMFFGLLFLLRGLAILPVYKRVLVKEERIPFALMTATGLPLIVAITELGVEHGEMNHDTAAALVGAGMLSILIFPLVALLKRSKQTLKEASEDATVDYTPV